MKYLIILALCLVTPIITAQSFKNRQNYLSAGLGVDPLGHRSLGGSSFDRTSIGPIQIAYERGVTDLLGIGRIGVGGAITQTFYVQKYTGSLEEIITYNRSRSGVFVRAAYHFEVDISKMDLYAGLGAGLYFNRDKRTAESSSSPFTSDAFQSMSVSGAHALFVGIRYYFTEVFGGYAEAGFGSSLLSAGIVYKL